MRLLGGDSKAVMFVQISPNENDLSETICSLNFASRVRGVELGPARKQLDIAEFVKYKQMVKLNSSVAFLVSYSFFLAKQVILTQILICVSLRSRSKMQKPKMCKSRTWRRQSRLLTKKSKKEITKTRFFRRRYFISLFFLLKM